MRSRTSITLVVTLGVLVLPFLVRVARADQEASCFSHHLAEAIALNRARAPLYAALSDGASEALSRRLVASEYATLAVAYPLEAAAAVFWRHGIPILCADFVPMAETPPAPTALDPAPPRLDAFEPVDRAALSGRLRAAYARGGFAGAHAALEREIHALEAEPRFHCMLRHMLESAARVAWLAPIYERMAEERGTLVSPRALSRALLELHLGGLALAADLDARAAPLAARGVPIICRDVPPIPIRPAL